MWVDQKGVVTINFPQPKRGIVQKPNIGAIIKRGILRFPKLHLP